MRLFTPWSNHSKIRRVCGGSDAGLVVLQVTTMIKSPERHCLIGGGFPVPPTETLSVCWSADRGKARQILPLPPDPLKISLSWTAVRDREEFAVRSPESSSNHERTTDITDFRGRVSVPGRVCHRKLRLTLPRAESLQDHDCRSLISGFRRRLVVARRVCRAFRPETADRGRAGGPAGRPGRKRAAA